jgi:pyridoxine 5-phosphate synthase
VWAATACELAGADGITVHLREDRRHIQDRDLAVLRHTVRGVLNLEMAATDEMVARALELRPDVVTLVPEKREERTTEGGLSLENNVAVQHAVKLLGDAGVPVSLFIDPSEAAVRASKELGAPRVELHTGDYCEKVDPITHAGDVELERLARAAALGLSLGLHVAAGHGLDYNNVAAVAAIPEITELNIGHAIVARAVLVGMERAVREMIALVR